jgi:hypothetical protein
MLCNSLIYCVIVDYIPRRKVLYSCRENNSLSRGSPRGELVLETQEWYFRRGLYTILFGIITFLANKQLVSCSFISTVFRLPLSKRWKQMPVYFPRPLF